MSLSRCVRSVVVLLALALCVSLASAQGWEPYEFTASERYVYKMLTYVEDGYEDEDWTIPRFVAKERIVEIDVRQTGRADEYGDPIFEVTTRVTREVPRSELAGIGADLFFGTVITDVGLVVNPFHFFMLQLFFEETEWEIGERVNIFGMGRVAITGQETLGGRTGYVVQLETGGAAERTVTGVWVVDLELAMPIGIRTYDDGGNLQSEVLLQEYQRY